MTLKVAAGAGQTFCEFSIITWTLYNVFKIGCLAGSCAGFESEVRQGAGGGGGEGAANAGGEGGAAGVGAVLNLLAFTSTKVQILTQEALLGAGSASSCVATCLPLHLPHHAARCTSVSSPSPWNGSTLLASFTKSPGCVAQEAPSTNIGRLDLLAAAKTDGTPSVDLAAVSAPPLAAREQEQRLPPEQMFALNEVRAADEDRPPAAAAGDAFRRDAEGRGGPGGAQGEISGRESPWHTVSDAEFDILEQALRLAEAQHLPPAPLPPPLPPKAAQEGTLASSVLRGREDEAAIERVQPSAASTGATYTCGVVVADTAGVLGPSPSLSAPPTQELGAMSMISASAAASAAPPPHLPPQDVLSDSFHIVFRISHGPDVENKSDGGGHVEGVGGPETSGQRVNISQVRRIGAYTAANNTARSSLICGIFSKEDEKSQAEELEMLRGSGWRASGNYVGGAREECRSKTRLLVASGDGVSKDVRIWCTATGEMIEQLPPAHSTPLQVLAIRDWTDSGCNREPGERERSGGRKEARVCMLAVLVEDGMLLYQRHFT